MHPNAFDHALSEVLAKLSGLDDRPCSCLGQRIKPEEVWGSIIHWIKHLSAKLTEHPCLERSLNTCDENGDSEAEASPEMAEATPALAQLNEALGDLSDRLSHFEDEDFNADLMHLSEAEIMALVVKLIQHCGGQLEGQTISGWLLEIRES
ncbi:MAG TPA: hypothetical protein V6C84_24645 [Coleofasciculaceae cyanobacterium]|jgi:hypothetical protein